MYNVNNSLFVGFTITFLDTVCKVSSGPHSRMVLSSYFSTSTFLKKEYWPKTFDDSLTPLLLGVRTHVPRRFDL